MAKIEFVADFEMFKVPHSSGKKGVGEGANGLKVVGCLDHIWTVGKYAVVLHSPKSVKADKPIYL